MLKSANLTNYRQIWHSLSHEGETSFKVKACTDAMITLSKYPGLTHLSTYEIVIGGDGNRNIKIRRNRRISRWDKTVTTPGIIDCHESRWFWISKYGDTIQVGKGPIPGSFVELSFTDSNRWPINSIQFSTSERAVGQWEFSKQTGTLT